MKRKNLWVPLVALLERNSIVSIPQVAQLLGSTHEDVFATLEELAFSYDAAGEGLILEHSYASLVYRGDNRVPRLHPEESDVLASCLCATENTNDAPAVLQLLTTLATACENPGCPLLRIEYQGEGDSAPHERLVKPHELYSANGHEYLRAYCHHAQGERDFRLDRIKNACVEDDDSKIEEYTDAHPPHQTQGSTQTACDNTAHNSHDGKLASENITAVLTLTDERLVEELPQAHITRRFESGWCEAQLPWYGSAWLPKHIAASGGAIRPVRPTTLREATNAYIQELLAAL